MVFATEFDPVEQSARAISISDHTPPNHISPSRIAQPNAPQAPTLPSARPLASVPNAASKVVPLQPAAPLQLGAPAVRVSHSSLPLSKKAKLPFGLKLLNRLQQGSAVIACLLVAGALGVYGSTVYVDKSTNHALTQLDSLQSESQQLTTANESIKQSLAEQAIEPDSGLEPYEAGDVLFLKPAPQRKAAAVEAETQPELPGPMGY